MKRALALFLLIPIIGFSQRAYISGHQVFKLNYDLYEVQRENTVDFLFYGSSNKRYVQSLDENGNIVYKWNGRFHSLNLPEEDFSILDFEVLSEGGALWMSGSVDVNRDGIEDLMLLDKRKIYICQGLGDGKFKKPNKPVKSKVGLNDMYPMMIADDMFAYHNFDYDKNETEVVVFELDGSSRKPFKFKLDKQISTYGSIQLNEKKYLLIRPTTHHLDLVNLKGKTQLSYKFREDFEQVHISDFNKDGALDFIVSDYYSITRYTGINNSTTLSRDTLVNFDELKNLKEISDTYKDKDRNTVESMMETAKDRILSSYISICDMNNDGYDDILLSGEYFIVYENDQKGGFNPIALEGAPFDPDIYLVDDLNGDGLMDLGIVSYYGLHVFLRKDAHFEQTLISDQGYLMGFGSCDLDKDGDLDIMVRAGQNILHWSENKEGKFNKITPFKK